RHADEQRMAAGKNRHQRALDHVVLAKDHLSDRLANPRDVGQRCLGLSNQILLGRRSFRLGGSVHGNSSSSVSTWPRAGDPGRFNLKHAIRLTSATTVTIS